MGHSSHLNAVRATASNANSQRSEKIPNHLMDSFPTYNAIVLSFDL